MLNNTPGVIKYFGSFVNYDSDQSTALTYNILMEYSDLDLNEFFARRSAPKGFQEIHYF